MSRMKMFLAGAVAAVASLVASGPASATATTFLFDDGPLGTTLVITVDGTVVNTIGPTADQQQNPNSFAEFVTGAFSIPITKISILDPGTSLVSDEFQISTGNSDRQFIKTISLFGSNDISPVVQPIFNPVTETGLIQTLFTTQDEQGNSLEVQFLSEADAPVVTTKSVPEPSTIVLFGAALAALSTFGMIRRRFARSRV